ncbi:MAG TPA: stage V sporulation protein AD [Candidatus Scybalocola faecavium]|nr:stage V sporulation protein AD [Candidatus Scybalocola faecavium]
MKKTGNATFIFEKPPLILESSGITGPKEGEGPLGKCFDQVWEDPMMGKKTWEEAESELQKKAVETVLEKSGMVRGEIDCFFAGDLLGQIIASSFGLASFHRPLFGLYGACSTMGESLILAAMCIDGGFAGKAVAVTSSHFASAERQFRFPSEYGNQRPLSATWTVTGSGAVLLGAPFGTESEKLKQRWKQCPRITMATPGKIVDMGVRDSMNMGACMAPAACDTIETHFRDTGTKPEDYDAVITGDLGYVGHDILVELMGKKGYDMEKVHMDCGIEIFDRERQDTHAGGSGCGCSAVVLSAMILPRLMDGTWKKVLFVPTGALLSPISFNEGRSVPGIAHGVVIQAP